MKNKNFLELLERQMKLSEGLNLLNALVKDMLNLTKTDKEREVLIKAILEDLKENIDEYGYEIEINIDNHIKEDMNKINIENLVALITNL